MRQKKLISLALGLLLAVFCLPGTARAYDAIPHLGEKLCTLTVASPHEGVRYDLYKVCDIDQWVKYTPFGAFSRDEELRENILYFIRQSRWEDLTGTLERWLLSHTAEKAASGQTGADGTVRFEDLDTGLYLVHGHRYLTDRGYYEPVNFMVCLPNWEAAGSSGSGGASGGWVYDVTARNKGSDSERTTTARYVLKRWRGDKGIDRPESITVNLWRVDAQGNAELYDTVTLDRGNNWRSLWEDLDNSYRWIVEEASGDSGYVVDYDETGINVTITNTYVEDDPKHDPDPDPPEDEEHEDHDDPPNIPGEELEDPDTPLSDLPEDLEDPPDEWTPEEDLDDPDTPLTRLPQTGVLWWPVPFLALGGMFLFILGWGLNRREQYDEE